MPERARGIVKRAANRNAKGTTRQKGGRAGDNTKSNAQRGRRRKPKKGKNRQMKRRASEKGENVVGAARPAKPTWPSMTETRSSAPRVEPEGQQVDRPEKGDEQQSAGCSGKKRRKEPEQTRRYQTNEQSGARDRQPGERRDAEHAAHEK